MPSMPSLTKFIGFENRDDVFRNYQSCDFPYYFMFSYENHAAYVSMINKS